MDFSILSFLAAPFAASLIIAGIHAYLGVHVVERGVIFVDLSLAQIAALGASIAILLPFTGGDPHGRGVYWISLFLTFIGAAVFSTIRVKRARIPQEAIIGICYAVASAASILAMSKATSESEHLKDMLVGNILAVSWHEVGKTAALYGVVGLFHFIFRRQFLAISMSHHHDTHHHDVEPTGLSVRFWDFLFYASFGFVVTSSVSITSRQDTARMLPTSMSFRCSLSEVALLMARMVAAEATAYEMPMMASCGMRASWPLIIEKMAAPMNVNPRLIQ